ncbi:MAG: multiheme c-type cytochrome [Phycisphaerae bacterium]
MVKVAFFLAAASAAGVFCFDKSNTESGPVSNASVAAASHAAVLVAARPGAAERSYVGSKKCKKCHLAQYKSWAKTKMGDALASLTPGVDTEIKEQFKLDVNKNYATDEGCLRCHTTGFGKTGGYQIPDPDNKKSVRKAKKLQDVGCESCHGPGSEYVKVFEEIFKSKRMYSVEELYAAGLNKMEESVCLVCHNDQSATAVPGAVFDFEQRKKDGTHEHFPLKQRKD